MRVRRTGYDRDFLGVRIDPPSRGRSRAKASERLDYVHFSLVMQTARRLAWWVAWNIDGLTLYPGESVSRAGLAFVRDPRLPADQQVLDDVYARNHLDRGHIARRADLLWGTLAQAKAANKDSFHFTNITPQMDDFNQSGKGGVWGLLENAVLEATTGGLRRLSVIGGPVLGVRDPAYRGVRLPKEHWKALAYVRDGLVRVRAFLLTQDLHPSRIEARDAFEEFETYRVGLDLLEARTGLSLASLRGAAAEDGVDGAEGRDVDARAPRAQLVREVSDVDW